MLKEILIQGLEESEAYFDRSASCLTEEHSTFKPSQETMTAAQQVLST